MDKSNNDANYEKRPWGSFTILDEADFYKVKRLEVLPEMRLSYQRHRHRTEHWFVVQGTAKVTLNGKDFLVESGNAVDIKAGDAHRIQNPDAETTLVLIETQTGTYFGEDDIERIDDDFGRAE
jgi:mannose-6-phosphate isomerase-like protein (cupin superfamily)